MDWRNFLTDNGISYITEGKNVRKGCFTIKCPFCGPSDPSEHLNINPITNRWNCWRNNEHFGDAAKLIAVVRGCSYEEAWAIADTNERSLGPSNGLAGLRAKMTEGYIRKTQKILTLGFPDHFSNISSSPSSERFLEYLDRKRGFGEDAKRVVHRYGLMKSFVAEWYMRLIIPFYVNGLVRGWTARSILKNAELRYLTHPPGGGKDFVYNYDYCLEGGSVLTVVEGPFGAMKIDFYGRRQGIHSVATLGVSYTDEQIGLIYGLAKRFDRVVTIFDKKAEHMAIRLLSRLRGCGRPISTRFMESEDRDCGDWNKKEVLALK